MRQGETYQDWSKRLKCYVSLDNDDLAQAISIAEAFEVWRDLGAERREADRVLYNTLPVVASDEYFTQVQKVMAESGVEAWRRLQRRFGEVDPTRRCGLLSNVLSPNFRTGDPIDGVDKWTQHVKNYEVSSGEKLNGSVKVIVLLKTVIEPLRTQLQKTVITKATVDGMVKMVEDYSRLSRS